MAAVGLSAAAAEARLAAEGLADTVVVACDNSPVNVTLSGAPHACHMSVNTQGNSLSQYCQPLVHVVSPCQVRDKSDDVLIPWTSSTKLVCLGVP